MLLTPLSRAILAAGILTILGGGAMGSMPAVVAGAALILLLFSRAVLFLSAENRIIASLQIERSCDIRIVRQYGIIPVTLSATLDHPFGCVVLLRDNPGPGF
ncbi:hypothetical protein, partial [Methanocalculus sp.]|uniref:hypothetical protein n=1 Tax=Methanocalculus sp. TaxID=2004547 RepID=UPI0026019DD4